MAELHLSVMVTFTTTDLNDGRQNTFVKHHVFTVPREPLLKEETAIPMVGHIVDHFHIPMDPAIVEKVVDAARRDLVPVPGSVPVDGVVPLMTTIWIAVNDGELSAVTNDYDDDDVDYTDDDTDSDEDEDEEEDEDVEMEEGEEEEKKKEEDEAAAKKKE